MSSSSPTSSLLSLLVLVLVVLVGLLQPTNGLANCPNGCECDDDTLMVNCGEGRLDVLPIALNPAIQRLVIKNNKLKTIDSSMQFYAQLTFLDLSFNDMVTIPERSFAYHAKLQELHLNHNKIGQVSNKTFTGLSTISVLNLRGNLIAELEFRTFSPMVRLEELNLGQNRISHIDPHALDGLVNLRVLYLDDNTLTTVPSQLTFQSLPSLAELYLGTNSFMTIPGGAFQDLKGLTRLDLRGAGLHNISAEALKGLESLRYMDLSDNRLTAIPTAALQRLGRLEELSIGQNDFEVVASGAFAGLRELRRLELTGAQRLRRVESGAFTANTNLEQLNLSSNKQLNELHANALGGLPHLSSVILKENQLSTLAEGLIPWADLQTLDLSENPFVCDCQLMWLRNLLISKNASNQYAPVVCAYPATLRDLPLAQLSEPLLGCTHGAANKQAIIGILVVACAALITTLALVLYTCRRRIREMLKGHSALGRKEREYQKTFSDEEYMTRPPPGCGGVHPAGAYPCSQSQYMGSRPIPVTEL
ncbi:carboxypeptidase N subunit 2 [Drosophila madeirensis]